MISLRALPCCFVAFMRDDGLSGFAVPREGAREAEAHAEAILDARITSGGMEPIVEAGPSCRRGRLQCGQVIAISSSLRGRGYAMLLEP